MTSSYYLDHFGPEGAADWMDAMADLAYEQEEAMRESEQDDWSDGVEDISKEELYACDHYNERYALPNYD